MKTVRRIIVAIIALMMLMQAVPGIAASRTVLVTSVRLNYSSKTLELVKGKEISCNLKATVSPTKATDKSVIWTSSDNKVATVSSSGKVIAVGKGACTITCTANDASKKKATCKITVKDIRATKVSLNATSKTLKLEPNKEINYTLKATISPNNATDKSVTWKSSDEKVATVSSNGKVVAVGKGTCTITCTAADGSKKYATCKITVTDIKVSGISLNKTSRTLTLDPENEVSYNLKATISPNNATNKSVTWKSSNKNVATVTKDGKVVAVGKGTCTITCTAADGSGKKATCSITVKDVKVTKVTLNKTSHTLELNPGNEVSVSLTETIAPKNATNKSVTWKSSNNKVATVTKAGKVVAVGKGTCTITCAAADGSGKQATCKITVKEHQPVITTKEETKTETIPFETKTVNDSTRYEDEGDKVTQQGVNGTKKVVYTVTFTDGVETGRKVKSSTITKQPVNKIINHPTKKHTTETREVVCEEMLAYSTEIRKDDTRLEGEADLIIQEGVNGKIVTVYTVTYKDGTETGRVVKSEKRTEPVKKIISHATGKKPTAPVITTKTETKTETIPYETEYQNDSTRYPEDGNKTVQAGKNGTKTITYTVTYTNGVETSREKTEEKITVNPIKEIVSVPCKNHTVQIKEETKTKTIAFTTETQNDDSRTEGEPDLVVQEGVNGKIVTVYTVTYTDGVETGRVVKSENRTEPVKKIISHATGKKPTTTTKTVVETEEIPYTSTTESTSSMYKGETSVVQEGRNGTKDVTYEIVLDSNGNQISKTAVSETITKAMKPEIVYVGTFEPSFSYEYVTLDLSPWMHGTRSGSLDSSCAAQAMSMAQNGAVAHSGEHTAGESVGGWSSASAAASGVAAHGGDGLAWSEYWGVGCVKVTKTTPGGGAVVGYYACAQAGGGLLDGYPSQE